jgi:hypothetical protein
MPRGSTHNVRSRSVVLNERDELAFSRVLREFCPQTMILEVVTGRPPVIVPNIPAGRIFVHICMPSPGHETEWDPSRLLRDPDSEKYCRFHYERGCWGWYPTDRNWFFDPPSLEDGLLYVSYPRGDKEMQRFAMRVQRLVNKVLWKGNYVGLDACIWSQTGGVVRRAVNGKLIDPSADIRLNKYYDDTLWDDRLPDVPTMHNAHYLEYHDILRKERSGET